MIWWLILLVNFIISASMTSENEPMISLKKDVQSDTYIVTNGRSSARLYSYFDAISRAIETTEAMFNRDYKFLFHVAYADDIHSVKISTQTFNAYYIGNTLYFNIGQIYLYYKNEQYNPVTIFRSADTIPRQLKSTKYKNRI
jgi:hypothetical protein